MEQPPARYAVTDFFTFVVYILQMGQNNPVSEQVEGAVHNLILTLHIVTDQIAGVEHNADGAGRHFVQYAPYMGRCG
ncbi:hypothetical protein D3C74_458180 [compost metagenome]